MSQKAVIYSQYKSQWFDKNNVAERLDKILNSPSYKNEKILKIDNQNFIKIKVESLNPKLLNQLLNRILNEEFLVRKVNIQTKSLMFEIGVH